MSDEPLVRDNPELSRYEILVGGEVAGFTDYATHGDLRAMPAALRT